MILQDLSLSLSALYPGVSFYFNWPSDFSYVLYLKQKHQGQGWKELNVYDIVLILPSNTDAVDCKALTCNVKWKRFISSRHGRVEGVVMSL